MDRSTETLATLIHRKVELLTLLKQLAEKQFTVIAREDTTLLLKLLAGKQSVVDQLQGIERDLMPFREEDPEARVWRSPEARQACQQEAAQAERLLQEILDLDKQ